MKESKKNNPKLTSMAQTPMAQDQSPYMIGPHLVRGGEMRGRLGDILGLGLINALYLTW